MAAGPNEGSSDWLAPSETLRRLQELGSQLSGAARTMAEEFAKTPAGQMTQPMARLGEQAVEFSTLWVAPVRAILEEQQQLIDAVSSWAEEQRKLADRFSELASRHRQLTDQVMQAITPTLDHVDRLTGRATTKDDKASSTS